MEEVFGEVFGLTVRSRDVGSQFGAWLKSLRGGELKGMTKMLTEGRQHATERLMEEARSKGADAVVAFRFDTSELGSTWTEVCAYGTAVRARKLVQADHATAARHRDEMPDRARRKRSDGRRSVPTFGGAGATSWRRRHISSAWHATRR